jgi:hypothetical protein
MSRHAALLALLLAAGVASGQSVTPPAGGPYVMRKQVVATGGARASGGAFVLTGTAGQPDAGPIPVSASGGAFRMSGGFHAKALPPLDTLFRNGFEN